MGVYHFMGLGRSVGAVTAPLSYLAARYERDNPLDQEFFARSGEVGQADDLKRGDVEALVLFATDDVYRGVTPSYDYQLNRAGSRRGRKCNGANVPSLLKDLLEDPLQVLTQTSRDTDNLQGRDEISVFWCIYEPHNPVQSFERFAQALSAAKSVGGLGKEVWLNLTGGNNIINSAMYLAVSLLGVPARLYYTWTENPDCVRHPVSRSNLGDEGQDNFWVDLPIVYFNFEVEHSCLMCILETLQGDRVQISELYGLAKQKMCLSHMPDLESAEDRYTWLHRRYLMPLETQQLLEIAGAPGDAIGNLTVTLDSKWSLMKRYYEAVSAAQGPERSLFDLAKDRDWLHHETWPVSS
jgi:hypothetical protein